MSGDGSALVSGCAVSPIVKSSFEQSDFVMTSHTGDEQVGKRQPCIGQEAKVDQPSGQPVAPPRRRASGQSVNKIAGQNSDMYGTSAVENGVRPSPQGATTQSINQTARSSQDPPSPDAMKAVVLGGMSAAAVGLGVTAGEQTANTNGSQRTMQSDDVPRSVSLTALTNGYKETASELSQQENADESDSQVVELRKHPARSQFRHAHSEADTSDIQNARRRSQTMAEMKEHAYNRLQEELLKAQTDLRLRDEECEKLSKVRDQMEHELDDLTASLFEEANKMVQEANVKRMHTEKLLSEANQNIEVLAAEVVALKQLVLTSTPSSPNKHLHPQIAETKEKKVSKPFWKTHRRSTSHHEFTKESRQVAEAQQHQAQVQCKDLDPACYDQFLAWRHKPLIDPTCPFLARVMMEDITPCLNFSNKKLANRVQHCVEQNTLTIEPIPGDNSYPRKCSLTETNKLCNYKIKLEDDTEWYSISQMCRNRIATVCDFYTYIRYIQQGLVRHEDKDAFLEITRLRRQMAFARLGLL